MSSQELLETSKQQSSRDPRALEEGLRDKWRAGVTEAQIAALSDKPVEPDSEECSALIRALNNRRLRIRACGGRRLSVPHSDQHRQLFFSLPPLSIPNGSCDAYDSLGIDRATQFGLVGAQCSFERRPFQLLAMSIKMSRTRGLGARSASDDFDRVLCPLHRQILTHFPRTLQPANAATGITLWSASSAPGHTRGR